MIASTNLCEICGENPSAGVCQVALCLPMSRAHCERCLELVIDTYDDVVSQVWVVPLEQMNEWARDICYRSLLAAGKTLEDLARDIAYVEQEYDKCWREQEANEECENLTFKETECFV